jgi:hypothetical protein
MIGAKDKREGRAEPDQGGSQPARTTEPGAQPAEQGGSQLARHSPEGIAFGKVELGAVH